MWCSFWGGLHGQARFSRSGGLASRLSHVPPTVLRRLCAVGGAGKCSFGLLEKITRRGPRALGKVPRPSRLRARSAVGGLFHLPLGVTRPVFQPAMATNTNFAPLGAANFLQNLAHKAPQCSLRYRCVANPGHAPTSLSSAKLWKAGKCSRTGDGAGVRGWRGRILRLLRVVTSLCSPETPHRRKFALLTAARWRSLPWADGGFLCLLQHANCELWAGLVFGFCLCGKPARLRCGEWTLRVGSTAGQQVKRMVARSEGCDGEVLILLIAVARGPPRCLRQGVRGVVKRLLGLRGPGRR